MKMKKFIILIFLISGCSKTDLFVSLPRSPVAQGTTFNIDVAIYNEIRSYDLPDEPWYWVLSETTGDYNVSDLYGVALDIWYDPSVISFVSMDASQGFLSSAQLAYSFRNSTPGKLVVALSLEGTTPGVNGSGNILTLTFRAETPGTSTILLHDLHIYDSTGNKLDGYVIINPSDITVQ